MKFIGHLDMVRYFQKVMRRSEVDVAYSEGFSPHQKMSFASPLSVGVLSRGNILTWKLIQQNLLKLCLKELTPKMQKVWKF